MVGKSVYKTQIMGRKNVDIIAECAYVSFYNNQRMKRVFEEDYDIQRIITNINIETHVEVTPGIPPIEVKAEDNLQSQSLKVYCEKFKPQYAVKTSMSNYREQECGHAKKKVRVDKNT